MKLALSILILSLLSSTAALQSNKVWAIYGIDSFSINDVWQGYMRTNGFTPAREFNYSTNGYSFGNWVSNVFPQLLSLLPPSNSGTQAVVFMMGGVNPNTSHSYADPPEYTPAEFIANHSNFVWRLHQSNALAVAFTITHLPNETNDALVSANYYHWKSNINVGLLAGNADFKIDTSGRWANNDTNFPDTIHPAEHIYAWIGTNTAAALTTNPVATASATRRFVGALR